MAPECPYCKVPTVRRLGREVFPKRPDLATNAFFVCSKCTARVGCHARTGDPLGIPANAELRALRIRCHDAFDPLWKRAAAHLWQSARRGAYAWLAAELGLERVHFGEADESLARRVLAMLTFLDEKPSVALLVTLGDNDPRDYDYDALEPDPWESPGGGWL
jgi:hypothetical protein